jgi:hypothetical protein
LGVTPEAKAGFVHFAYSAELAGEHARVKDLERGTGRSQHRAVSRGGGGGWWMMVGRGGGMMDEEEDNDDEDDDDEGRYMVRMMRWS